MSLLPLESELQIIPNTALAGLTVLDFDVRPVKVAVKLFFPPVANGPNLFTLLAVLRLIVTKGQFSIPVASIFIEALELRCAAIVISVTTEVAST